MTPLLQSLPLWAVDGGAAEAAPTGPPTAALGTAAAGLRTAGKASLWGGGRGWQGTHPQSFLPPGESYLAGGKNGKVGDHQLKVGKWHPCILLTNKKTMAGIM